MKLNKTTEIVFQRFTPRTSLPSVLAGIERIVPAKKLILFFSAFATTSNPVFSVHYLPGVVCGYASRSCCILVKLSSATLRHINDYCFVYCLYCLLQAFCVH